MQATNARDQDEQSGVTARHDVSGPSRPPQLGEVVRDAMDHAHVIARDTVTLGRLEVEHLIAVAKEEARTAIAHGKVEAHTLAGRARVEGEDLVTRFGFLMVTATVASIGIALLSIAIFLGLGAIIPSLAARFGIFAVVFLSAAAFTARRVVRRGGVSVRPTDERLRHIAPIHPLDGEDF